MILKIFNDIANNENYSNTLCILFLKVVQHFPFFIQALKSHVLPLKS